MSGKFPPGMPNTGQHVPANPADLLRDVFLFNKGRINKTLAENMRGRHSFTYGLAIHDAWNSLLEDGTMILDGNDYVWPIQEAICKTS